MKVGNDINIKIIILSVLLLSIPVVETENLEPNKVIIYFIYSDICRYCASEKYFLRELKNKYPWIEIRYINVFNADNRDEILKRYKINGIRTPETFIGDMAFVGFNDDIDYLLYSNKYNAYIGNRRQIESAVIRIRNRDNITLNITPNKAVEISKNDPLVNNFLKNNSDSFATINLSNGIYLVAWWNNTRLSLLNYPNILTKIDSRTGTILESFKPLKRENGVVIPYRTSLLADIIVYIIIFIYLLSYVIYSNFKFKKRFKNRDWLIGFLIILFLSALFLVIMHPKDNIGYLIKFIKKTFPFYW